MRFSLLLLGVLVTFTTALAQQRSAKRGICWDEGNQKLTDAPVSKMAPGISWIYNWGQSLQGDASNIGAGDGKMVLLPMCWNGGFDETALCDYLTAHPEVQYLLGFNEPNFSSQSNMTPQQAANAWPSLERIADDYHLELVAPALNFTGETVGGKKWDPFDWYNEFFRLYPTARVDYLAMHCYMNWAENVDWIASRYFYTDKGESDLYRAAQRNKYPYLVKYLDDYKAANGHFPRMFLTEFCSWEYSVYPYNLTLDFQIDQMTQKVQYLELSDLVAGYAWFMGNPSKGENEAWPRQASDGSNSRCTVRAISARRRCRAVPDVP